ncbi:sugar kinase [Arenibacterium sp. LLYu02]|uniref:sugar kinase n=1 Tax=Arenibacterium sp. LLYu02 TaxID=3404132 RepID=UPI003B21F08A
MTPRVLVSIGEAMAEMSPLDEGTYRLGYAGDCLNLLWYAQAVSDAGFQGRFVTAVGEDAISSGLTQMVRAQGIETEHMMRRPRETLGLYMITLAEGERSFSYWRGQSAAKHLASDQPRLRAALAGADVVFFSGVTLAILPPEDRKSFWAEIDFARRNGALVAFDSNIRPQLWSSAEEMRRACEAAYRRCDLALATLEDERLLFGAGAAEDAVARLQGFGVLECVIKQGDAPCLVASEGQMTYVAAEKVAHLVDTTGAGDSFNGGYLAARMAGQDPVSSAQFAHRIAAQVVQTKGALMATSDCASLPKVADLSA